MFVLLNGRNEEGNFPIQTTRYDSMNQFTPSTVPADYRYEFTADANFDDGVGARIDIRTELNDDVEADIWYVCTSQVYSGASPAVDNV